MRLIEAVFFKRCSDWPSCLAPLKALAGQSGHHERNIAQCNIWKSCLFHMVNTFIGVVHEKSLHSSSLCVCVCEGGCVCVCVCVCCVCVCV